MLRYRKVDVSEGIEVNKTSVSKECELCHHCFFKDIEFKFKFKEQFVINAMIDLLVVACSFEDKQY